MNKKIINAIIYMIEKHGNDTRKESKIPYYTHPLGVMNILLEEQAFDSKITDDVIIAGLFHDLNEDANISIEEISKNWGREVARLVKNVSEPEDLKRDPDQRGTWKKRKEHSLEILKKSDRHTKMIFCADKLDNVRSINRDIITEVDVWKKFNASHDEIFWYYKSTLKALKSEESIKNTRMFKLLDLEIKQAFTKK